MSKRVPERKFPRIFFGWWTVLTSGILGCWVAGYQIYGFSALFKPIASELGFNRAVTSVAAGIGRLGGGFESLLAGWIADRFGPRWIVFCGVFFFGLGMILMNFMIRARYFGRKAYGAIGGSAQMLVMPVGLVAPIYLGWIYDTTGSYLAAFLLVTVLLAVGTILMCLIPPPRPPE
jgi:cyanate permease